MIYLMRHGADSPDRCGGWSPYGLTDRGIRQVLAVGKALTGKGIEAIFSSDLLRAKESAEIVADYLGLPVTYLPQFRETNNGVLAGMLKTEAKKRYPGIYWGALGWNQSYPGGESPAQFFRRIETAWRNFKAEVLDRSVLLISHGGVMNLILCLETGIPYTNKEIHFRVADAELRYLE